MIFISYFLATIGVSIILSTISTSDVFSGHSDLTENQLRTIAQSYYALAAFSALSNLTNVVIVLVAYLHFTLMTGSADKIWFVSKWDTEINVLPQILLITGCISLVGCLCCGSFVVGNYVTGVVVCTISGSFVLMFLLIWKNMLRQNFNRSEKNILRYKNIYKQLLDN